MLRNRVVLIAACVLVALTVVPSASATSPYDTPYGIQWTRQFQGASNRADGGGEVIIGSDGTPWAGGHSSDTTLGPVNGGLSVQSHISNWSPQGQMIFGRHGSLDAVEPYPSQHYGGSIAVDASGNTYQSALTRFHFPGATNEGGSEPYVQKRDSDGNLLWTTFFGAWRHGVLSGTWDNAQDVAVDAAGNAWVCGYAQADLISVGSYTAGNGYDPFIFKVNADGSIPTPNVGIQPGGTPTAVGNDRTYGIAVDQNNGNVAIAGWSSDYTIGDPATYGPYLGGSRDGILGIYDSGMNQLAGLMIGGTGRDAVYSLKFDSDGNLLVGGYVDGDLATHHEGYVAKYSPDGTLLWSDKIGSQPGALDTVYAVDTDADGNIYVMGETVFRGGQYLAMLKITAGDFDDGTDTGTLAVGQYVVVEDGGALSATGTLTADSMTIAGTVTIDPGAAVNVEDLSVVVGGTMNADGGHVVVGNSLRVVDATITTNAGSFKARGTGMPSGAEAVIDTAGSVMTVVGPEGAGGELNAPGAGFAVTESATLNADASTAVLGSLSMAAGKSVTLTGAPTISFNDVGGDGTIIGSFSVRGALAPGGSIGNLAVEGDVALEDGATLAVEVTGNLTTDFNAQQDVAGISGGLDVSAADTAIAPSWVPGADATSMFGGAYLVATAGAGVTGEFGVLGGGNIGADYIYSVDSQLPLGGGAEGIEVVLKDQLAGDANLDGIVNLADIVVAIGSWQAVGDEATWFAGDVDFSSVVELVDIVLMIGNWQATPSGGGPGAVGAVPEPATILLLCGGAAALLFRRRRR